MNYIKAPDKQMAADYLDIYQTFTDHLQRLDFTLNFEQLFRKLFGRNYFLYTPPLTALLCNFSKPMLSHFYLECLQMAGQYDNFADLEKRLEKTANQTAIIRRRLVHVGICCFITIGKMQQL